MGLDIMAVRTPVFVKGREDATDEDWGEFTSIYAAEREWVDRLDGRSEGFYRAETERYGGWSYGGYNRLRELICLAAFGVPPQAVWDELTPFAADETFGGLVVLIHFSDCEGAFGPVTSRRIADALKALDLSKVTDPDERAYAEAGVARLLACFTDAADHDGFVVWS